MQALLTPHCISVPQRIVTQEIGLHTLLTKSAADGPIMYPIQRDILHDYGMFRLTHTHRTNRLLLPTSAATLLLQRLETLPHLGNVEDDILKAKLQLARAFRDLRQDPIAGLLHESGTYRIYKCSVQGLPGTPVLSVPVLDLGTTENKAVSSKSHLPALVNEVELMLLGATSRYQLRACPARWRRLATAIAHLRILRANMGHAAMVKSSQVASSLGRSTTSPGSIPKDYTHCIASQSLPLLLLLGGRCSMF
jgi:hypothetical protein